ncbi:DUF5017 domain-containing protein [Sphingobacterium faecium]|jgi:hypothetical protein|uniref:DUF5017 domain-containing protein n=1 Tax=Sphingobacterium TaxID=28453 RepID=UPI00143BCD1B|nr:DUF5017 domain-containing protein [Sphingobacterium sp. B16(2022)]NJI73302.1 DUF5017 domain-containing protein [Sphingobacterium sp. B16(2022)]
MKRLTIYIMTALLLASCMKEDIASADLQVLTSASEYRVGDTVVFRFEGAPDNIVFYSGEHGHNYELKDRQYADNDLQIDFKTLVQWGVIYQNLQLLVSNDFSGVYNQEQIAKATWVDISDKAVFSTGKDNTASGTVSLKPYVGTVDTASLYVAFRYTDFQKKQQNRWVIRTFNADKVSPEGMTTNVATMSSAGWEAVSILNDSKVWDISAKQLMMYGGVASDTDNDDWVISKGFTVKASVADKGIALKNISTTMQEYRYVYQSPGIYKAVFETSSDWYSGRQEGYTEVTVEIKP